MGPINSDYAGVPANSWTKSVPVVLVMNFALFVQTLAMVGVGATAQPTTALLDDLTIAAWLPLTFAIFSVSIGIPLSHASDYWSRKWFIVAPSTIGVAGLIMISRAKNTSTLVAGFCIAGIAFSSQPLLYTVVSEALPLRLRAVAQSTMVVAYGLGGMLALIIAGHLLRDGDATKYRIFWYIMIALQAVSLLAVVLVYHPTSPHHEPQLSSVSTLQRLPWPNYALLAGGLTMVVVSVAWTENGYNWAAALVLSLFIFGLALVTTLLGIERFSPWHRGIFPWAAMRDRNFVLAVACIVAHGAAFYPANAYFTYEATVVYGLDFLQSSLRGMIIYLAATFAGLVVGLVAYWQDSIRLPVILGSLVFLIWNILMATIKSDTSTKALWGFPVLGGIGTGLVIPSTLTIAQISLPSSALAITTATILAAKGFGTGLLSAIYNSILTKTISGNLGEKLAAAVVPLGFPPAMIGSLIQALSSGDPQIVATVLRGDMQMFGAAFAAFQRVYHLAFYRVWIASSCFSAAGLVAALFFRDPRPSLAEPVGQARSEEEQAQFETKDAAAQLHTGHIETVDV